MLAGEVPIFEGTAKGAKDAKIFWGMLLVYFWRGV